MSYGKIRCRATGNAQKQKRQCSLKSGKTQKGVFYRKIKTNKKPHPIIFILIDQNKK